MSMELINMYTVAKDFRLILRHLRNLPSVGTKSSLVRKHVIEQVINLIKNLI